MSQFALAGGAAASALGGVLGAASGNRAGRQARDWYNDRTHEGNRRYGSLLFGPSYRGLYPDSAGGSMTPQQQAQGMDAFTSATGGPVVDQMRNLADTVSARQTGNLAFYDKQTGDLDKLEDRFASADAQGAGMVSTLARGVEDAAVGRGEETERIIDRDAERRLGRLNNQSLARLASSGLGGSTMSAQALAMNTREVGEAADSAKVSARNTNTDRIMGARQFRALTEGNLYGQRRSDTDRRIGRAYGRAYGRGALEENNLGRDVALRDQIPKFIASSASSPIANPWVGQNTSQYYPGVSGSGSALSGAGNAMAMLGAYGLYGQRKRPGDEEDAGPGWLN